MLKTIKTNEIQPTEASARKVANLSQEVKAVGTKRIESKQHKIASLFSPLVWNVM